MRITSLKLIKVFTFHNSLVNTFLQVFKNVSLDVNVLTVARGTALIRINTVVQLLKLQLIIERLA